MKCLHCEDSKLKIKSFEAYKTKDGAIRTFEAYFCPKCKEFYMTSKQIESYRNKTWGVLMNHYEMKINILPQEEDEE